MHILFVDADPSRSVHWKTRLDSSDVSVRTVATDDEAIAASVRVHCGLALCDFRGGVCNWTDDVQSAIAKMRTRCPSVFCIVNRDGSLVGDQSLAKAAFAAGFDDCLFDDACEDEIRVKVQRAGELHQLNERLAQAQKLESIGELAAGIAHEINTPIQYVGDNTRFVQTVCGDITGMLECCQKLVGADSENSVAMTDRLRNLMEESDIDYLLEEVPFAIVQTLEGVDRVTNIVRAMKEFSHPGASEMTLTDLSKSIGNTVMVARNEWKYVADLATDFDPNLPLVPCLPGELNQVMLNMIVNASHAIADALGESPEEKGQINISTKLASPYAEIRISDSGSGISEENIKRIFTPFFTTKLAGKGTGQGLAIAHSVVVEKHGGTIHVESEVGRGTTFVVRLPLEVIAKVCEPEFENASSTEVAHAVLSD